MINILGWDIGGANIKVSFLAIENYRIVSDKTLIKYFPIWKRGKEGLGKAIKELLLNCGVKRTNLVLVTMTAELSDVYFTKREGVNHILDVVSGIFDVNIIKVLSVNGELLDVETAKNKYLDVAAANWYATGWLVSKLSRNCLVIDIGSTTTSIIPVINGKVSAKGKNDFEKLIYGELVYTGVLRTHVATITDRVLIGGILVPVSAEYFAQSGDIHLILGNISPKDYNVDTPDGRGISVKEAMARLARVVCADIEMLSNDEIISMAKYIYEKQVERVLEGIANLTKYHQYDFTKTPVYITGLGGNILAKPALKKLGFKDIRHLKNYIGQEAAKATPSYALALMGAEFLTGVELENWRL